MKIIPHNIDEDRHGRLVFIRDGLDAWRDYRRTCQWSCANTTKGSIYYAIASERITRLRDRLLRDIRDPQEVV